MRAGLYAEILQKGEGRTWRILKRGGAAASSVRGSTGGKLSLVILRGRGKIDTRGSECPLPPLKYTAVRGSKSQKDHGGGEGGRG